MSGLRQFASPLRVAPVRAIWLSLLTSSVGDWAAKIALAVLVLDRTGSAALSALVVAVSFVPWVGPGQVLATRLGHLRRVPVMIASDLARAAIYAVLLLHLPVGGVLALAFAAALANPPFEAARSSLTVEVCPEDTYGGAIALLDLTDQSAIVLGYLVGGAAVGISGSYRVALLVNVASFLLSAAVLIRVKEHRKATEPDTSAAQLGRGARVIRGDRVIRRALLVVLVAGLGVASVEATAAAYARLVLHAGAGVAGELAAAVPIGVIVVIPILPRHGSARRLLTAAAVVLLLGGAIGVVAFSVGHEVGAFAGFFGAGVLTGSVTPAQVAFQPRIPIADRPGVFSLAQGMAVGMQGAGAAVGGVVATVLGPRHGALLWAAVVVVSAVILLFLPMRVGSDPAGAGAGPAGGVPGPVASSPPAGD